MCFHDEGEVYTLGLTLPLGVQWVETHNTPQLTPSNGLWLGSSESQTPCALQFWVFP